MALLEHQKNRRDGGERDRKKEGGQAPRERESSELY